MVASANPETKAITLTSAQIKALDCACKCPSQATVRGKRHQFTDVHTLVEYGLVEWLHRETYNFMATDKGRAYHQRYHAIEKLKSAGWQIEATALRGWFIVTTPTRQQGMDKYDSIDAAWDTVLASEAVQS